MNQPPVGVIAFLTVLLKPSIQLLNFCQEANLVWNEPVQYHLITMVTCPTACGAFLVGFKSIKTMCQRSHNNCWNVSIQNAFHVVHLFFDICSLSHREHEYTWETFKCCMNSPSAKFELVTRAHNELIKLKYHKCLAVFILIEYLVFKEYCCCEILSSWIRKVSCKWLNFPSESRNWRKRK